MCGIDVAPKFCGVPVVPLGTGMRTVQIRAALTLQRLDGASVVPAEREAQASNEAAHHPVLGQREGQGLGQERFTPPGGIASWPS